MYHHNLKQKKQRRKLDVQRTVDDENRVLKLSWISARVFDDITFSNLGVDVRIYSNWNQIYKPSLSLHSTHLDDNINCIFPKGVDRFSADVEAMTGRKPFLWFRICWKYITLVCTIVSGLKKPYRYSRHVKLWYYCPENVLLKIRFEGISK